MNFVPRPLVFGTGGVDEIGVLDPVAVDHREAVDIGFLGDRTDPFGASGPAVDGVDDVVLAWFWVALLPQPASMATSKTTMRTTQRRNPILFIAAHYPSGFITGSV